MNGRVWICYIPFSLLKHLHEDNDDDFEGEDWFHMTKGQTRLEQGDFDIAGNNFPVFFTRDAMAFPDVIHAFKPNPKSHVQEDWRILDFLSHYPESLNTMIFF